MKSMMVVLFAAVASVVVAQGPMAKHGPMGGRGPASIDPIVRAALNPKIAEKLGLSEEQTKKLKELPDEKSALRDLHEKVRAGMNKQAELLNAEKIDEAAVMAALDEVWAMRKEIAKRQTRRLITVKGILTPDQIALVRESLKSIRNAGKSGKPGKPGKQGKPEKPAADKE